MLQQLCPVHRSFLHVAIAGLALMSSIVANVAATSVAFTDSGADERCGRYDEALPTAGATALMQKRHLAGHSLAANKQGKHQELGKKASGHARISHSGTVKMLLNEMNSFVETKGELGLDPDEIEHVHNIRALVEETILPAILESVETTREELDYLWEVVANCSAHVDRIANITEDRKDNLRRWEELHKQCRQKQQEIIQKKHDICTALNRSRLTIYSPEGQELVSPDVEEDVMIEYLERMEQFFCGRWELFYVEWQECEETIKNYTIIHAECTALQKTFEEYSCEWKKFLLSTCETFDTCWTNGAAAYRERKRALLDYHADLIKEYEGIVKIQCLWSAWIYEGMPCTINKTRVEECNLYPPNLTNVTIEYAPLPPPPVCDTSSVAFDTCSPEWLDEKYGVLPIGSQLRREIRSNCAPCPPYTYTLPPTEVDYITMSNMHHVGANTFIKIAGGLACDGVLKSRHPNVQKLVVSPRDIDGQINVRVYRGFLEFKINLASYICTLDGLDVSPYRVGDNIGIEFDSGEIHFSRNDVIFATLPSEIEYAWADIEVCSLPGTSVSLVVALVDPDVVNYDDDNTSLVDASQT